MRFGSSSYGFMAYLSEPNEYRRGTKNVLLFPVVLYQKYFCGLSISKELYQNFLCGYATDN